MAIRKDYYGRRITNAEWKERQIFRKFIAEWLEKHGTPDPSLFGGYLVDTDAGQAWVKLDRCDFEDGSVTGLEAIFIRFYDVERAKKEVCGPHCRSLNPHSGKYNFYFVFDPKSAQPTTAIEAVRYFMGSFVCLLPEEEIV